jgi:hypothetical protein
MVQPETLKLAALFILASLGGKTLATLITKRAMGLTTGEAGLMLGLTVPQAAATLAATVIGFDIGLFDQSVVNAVLVLILVTIVVATLVVERAKTTVEVPRRTRAALGKRILVALEDPDQAQIGFAIGARIAAPDSGVVRGLLGSAPAETDARELSLSDLRSAGFAVGVDVDPALLVHTSLAEGIINVVAAQRPSFVLVGQRSAAAHPAFGGVGEAVAASITAPVGIVIGDATRIDEVVLVQTGREDESDSDGVSTLAAELAARIGGKGVTTREAGASRSFAELAPGQLWITPAHSWQVLAAADPPHGAAMMMVLEPPPAPSPDETSDRPPPPGARLGCGWLAIGEHEDLAAVISDPHVAGRRVVGDPDRMLAGAEVLQHRQVGRAQLCDRVRLVVDHIQRAAVGGDRERAALVAGVHRRNHRVVGEIDFDNVSGRVERRVQIAAVR